MTIAEAREKCKNLLARVPRDLLIVAILVLASSASFGLGYLAGLDAGQGSAMMLEESPFATTSATGEIIASKNGTKYYFPWCTGAERISEANKVRFVSAAAASAAGYTLAAGCKEP